ncbi:hypothetical protein BGZ46_007232 [Entomortierella lignicola]|nr:hypothetical protein BGZ46_007232 [Entomortierella lignicola]
MTDPEAISALETNIQHVRSFSAFFNFFDAERAVQLLYPIRLDRFLSILENSSGLQSLTIDYFYGDSSIQTKLVSSLNCLPQLKRIDIVFHHWINSFTVLGIILASRQNAEFLRLEVDSMSPDSPEASHEPEDVLVAKEAIAKMEDTRYKELTLAFSNTYQESCFMMPLLEKSPQLECLSIKNLYDPYNTLPEMVHFFQTTQFGTRLKSLYFGDFTRWDYCDDVIADLLDVMAWNYKISRQDKEGKVANGLESFEIHAGPRNISYEWEPTLVISQKFSETLTLLRAPAVMIQLADFVQLVSGLPKLRLLDIGVLLVQGTSVQGYSTTLPRAQWTCLGLTTLNLNIKFIRIDEGTWLSSSTSMLRLCTNYIFSQIARLKDLEEMELHSNFDLLNLKHGYLRHLSRLKRLKKLTTRGYSTHYVDATDGQWIVENWPSLQFIHLQKGTYQQSGRKEMMDMQAVLLANNPSIKFSSPYK